MAYGDRAEVELMRWLLAVAFLASCAPAAAAPVQTEDPRVAVLSAQVQHLTDGAKHPTLMMYNAPFTMPAHWVTDLGLPDTFTIHLAFTASAPVRVKIVSLAQYADGRNGRTVTPAMSWPATTSLDVDVHDTEGCAGYVLLWESDSETVVTPNITITYAPADHFTGVCAN